MNTTRSAFMLLVVLFFVGCVSKDSDGTSVSVPFRIDTTDPEYLKTLPVYEPFGKPAHNLNNVVGTDKITDNDVKTVFFSYINLAQDEYDKKYDYWSSRFKNKSGYSYKNGEEFRQALINREGYEDEPDFKRVVEVLEFSRASDVAVIKARIFHSGYPVEYTRNNVYSSYYVFVNETGKWKWDGCLEARHHFTDDELRKMGFDPEAITNRR